VLDGVEQETLLEEATKRFLAALAFIRLNSKKHKLSQEAEGRSQARLGAKQHKQSTKELRVANGNYGGIRRGSQLIKAQPKDPGGGSCQY
jgi:hypothetical protein